jgi:hypothetical protein
MRAAGMRDEVKAFKTLKALLSSFIPAALIPHP